MSRRSPWSVFAIVAVLFSGAARALEPVAQEADSHAPGTHPLTTLHVEVLEEESGKPIRRAEVYVRSGQEGVEFGRTLSTNKNGRRTFLNVPRGTVLIQVTARGMQTFGARHDLTKEEETFTARLKPTAPEEPSPGSAGTMRGSAAESH